MTDKINQDEINAILWRACDTFRGTIDPSEYKNYILVMLFLKYISDVWREHYHQLQEKYGDDENRIRRQLYYERFVLPRGADYYTLYDQRNADNVGELINIALDAVEDANKEKLDGVFRNIDFNSEANLGRTKQRNERLKNLLEDFHDPRLDLRPSRGFLTVTTDDKTNTDKVEELVEGWYRRQAHRVFPERLEKMLPRFAPVANLAPTLAVRKMQSRWGSCTEAGLITLNLKLTQVAKPCIDYIIVHELCHLVEHNHSAAFYKLPDRMMPDWRQRRRALNESDFA